MWYEDALIWTVLQLQVSWLSACIDNWGNAKFQENLALLVREKWIHIRSMPELVEPLRPTGARVKNPCAYCLQRSRLKEIIALQIGGFHGGDCASCPDFIARPRRLCLAEWVSTKRANASCACVTVKGSSSSVWARKQERCCPLNLMPYVEKDCHWDWARTRKWKHDTTDLIQKK